MNHLYLYVALIGVAVVLFALTRGKSTPAAAAVQPYTPPSVDQELKDTLDEFMNELDRGNAQLVDSFVNLQKDYRQSQAENQQVIRALELRLQTLETMVTMQQERILLLSSQPREVKTLAEASAEETNLQATETVEATTAPSFAFNEKYAKVVELSRQGLTAEQIARATDIGIGEIQLVLGLANREEG